MNWRAAAAKSVSNVNVEPNVKAAIPSSGSKVTAKSNNYQDRADKDKNWRNHPQREQQHQEQQSNRRTPPPNNRSKKQQGKAFYLI